MSRFLKCTYMHFKNSFEKKRAQNFTSTEMSTDQLSTNPSDILRSRLGIGLKFQCRMLGGPRLLPGGCSALFSSSLFAVYLMFRFKYGEDGWCGVLAFKLSVRRSGGRDAELYVRAGDLFCFPLVSTAAPPLQHFNLFFMFWNFFVLLFCSPQLDFSSCNQPFWLS